MPDLLGVITCTSTLVKSKRCVLVVHMNCRLRLPANVRPTIERVHGFAAIGARLRSRTNELSIEFDFREIDCFSKYMPRWCIATAAVAVVQAVHCRLIHARCGRIHHLPSRNVTKVLYHPSKHLVGLGKGGVCLARVDGCGAYHV